MLPSPLRWAASCPPPDHTGPPPPQPPARLLKAHLSDAFFTLPTCCPVPSAQIACIELWVRPQTPSQLLLSEEIKVSVEVVRGGLKRSNAAPNKHLRQSSRQPRKNSHWSTVLQVPASCRCTHPRPAPRSRPPPSSCSR